MSLVVENPDIMGKIPVPSGANEIDILSFFNPDAAKMCLIILNQAINVDLTMLWDHSLLRVCADGGANRLYEFFGEEKERYIPDFIVGDFDSLTDEVKTYYQGKGAVLVHQASQYATDFQKAISVVSLYFQAGSSVDFEAIDTEDGLLRLAEEHSTAPCPPVTLLVVNALGGRFDQTVHSINQLYKITAECPSFGVFLVSLDDIVFLVPGGVNYIHYDKQVIGPICGLLPMGRKCTLSTQGLKWDLTNWESDICGGNVSSSNAVVAEDGVVVECTEGGVVVNLEWAKNFMAKR
ncbi:hypothetical protein BABINDRAFT_159821 [Babjeviella inositovora NRRL Y-12698]|uniref:Thiamine pyrophosphokinase n=1 Tax=Babjeviella inositovora NRRL Y-12698 TaxID=984486 RepID=A0A1E3QV92_9ASCO|nr:uncharacterized protein BABINDRAFT_159821 [Babjeviella inositovora NRRL Y-12698]ODQ81544.1 hypothetical protein BABINDRAFT_159821 [Babjeviella inositovora NRRL Y-12698]